ncbi:hypothetical protein BCEP27_20941 [Burkholderia cepacia]
MRRRDADAPARAAGARINQDPFAGMAMLGVQY